MLVLSRRLSEMVLFPDINASVAVVAVKRGVVRLGIEAPGHVTVLREELRQRPAPIAPAEVRVAAQASLAGKRLRCLVRNGLKTTSMGLGLARLHLRAGQNRDAEAVLEKIHDDVQRLYQRVGARRRRLQRPGTAGCLCAAAASERANTSNALLATCGS